MTHTIVASRRLPTSNLVSHRRWMPALLSALALVTGPAAWAASSTTSLIVSPSSPSSGDVVIMTAQVSSTSSTVAGGTVTFTDTYNSVQETLGTVQVQSTNGAAGTAILKTEVGGAGSHQFVATYSGTSTFTGSASSVSTVTFKSPYLTSTALVSTGTSPYKLTGTVNAYGPATPTGSVTFTNTTSNQVLGTVPLDSTTLQKGFAPYQSYPISGITSATYPTGLTVAPAIGDFNNDGYLDYAVPTNSGPIVILLGKGDGTFTTGTPISTAVGFVPTSAVVGDFDGNGNQDLAVLGSVGTVNLYKGAGDGTFSLASATSVNPPLNLTPPASRILAVGDFNRDGIQDLVATNSAINNVAVLIGLGTGSFNAASYYSVATSSTTAGGKPWNVVVGDLNKDGFLDLATASDGSSSISILQGKGDGTFLGFITVNTAGSQVGSVAIGDFDGDGVPDLASSSAVNNNIYILLNKTTTAGAAPTFASPVSYPDAAGPYYMTIGDFNRDGKVDIIVANTNPTTVSVITNNGTGGFPAANKTDYQVGYGSYFANAADINGDDQIDLTALTTNGVSVLLSGDSESASLSNNTFYGCGAQSVVATYGGDTNYGQSTSSSLSFTPAGLLNTTLTLTVTPVNGVVGQQYMLQATLSPYTIGTKTSTDGETITFTANGGPIGTATLSGGVATLLITPTGTGAYALQASYTKDCAFNSSTSNTVNTTVKKASILSWSNPAPITYGTPLSSTQLNATDSIPGTFTYTPAAGTILTVGTQTLSVTFTPTDNTYGQQTATVTIQVNKAAATIIWPTPTPITYGTPLSSLQLNATASTGYVQVPLSGKYNVSGIYDPGVTYNTGGFDNDGYSFSTSSISGSLTFNGMTFVLGPNNAPDAIYGTGTPIALPSGKYTDLYLLGAMVNNIAAGQTFTVTYTDGTTTVLNQNMSDWFNAAGWSGESVVQCGVKRNYKDGSQQADSVCVFGYDINLDPTRTVQSVTLPNNRNIVMLSMNLAAPSIDGTFVYTPAAGTVEPVGTNTLSVTFTPTDSTDYQPATSTVNLVVSNPVGTKVNPTISWANPADISYGTALSSTQLNAVAMGTARPTPVTPSDQLSVLSTSTDGTAFGLAGFDNAGDAYSYKLLNNGKVNFSGSTFTLGAPTVPNAITNGAVYTLQTPAKYATVYLIGAAIKDNQKNQPFVLTYNDSGNVVTQTLDISSWTNPAGYADETVLATTAYANTQSGGQKTSGSYSLYGYTINADPTRTLLSVSVPNNRNVVIMGLGFGDNAQVVVPGTYVYTPAAGTVLPVGNNQTLKVAFTPSNTAGYTSANATAKINVVKATPIITWPTPTAVPVGTTLSSTQLNAVASIGGTQLAGTYVYNPAAGFTENTAGTFTLKVTFTPNDTTDYATATGTVQLVVGSGTSAGGSPTFQTSECCFFSQPTPYQVTMTGAGTAPSGTVNVVYNGTIVGTGTLAASSGATSVASLMVNSIYFVPGNNTVTLNYLGDTNYPPSSSSATIALRNPAIQGNPASYPAGTSTLQIPYAFPRAGAITFNANPTGGSITDFTVSSASTCVSGQQEPANFVCTFSVPFTPGQPGIRRGVIQVNFTPSDGSANDPTLYLFLSSLGNAAQISLSSATQQILTSGLNQPQSLTFKPTDTSNSTLYVTNSNVGLLDTVPSTGGSPTKWNGSGTTLTYPEDVAFDAFGTLVVADPNAAKVWLFKSATSESNVNTGSFSLGLPTAARLDSANNIYIADAGNTPRIVAVNGETFDTTYTPSVVLSGSSLSFPQGMAVDNTGTNLYVGDGDLNTIQQINLTTGGVSQIAIAPCDATVTSCAWNSPGGMAFDINGDMFVTDSGQRVLMVPANHSASAPTVQLPLTGVNNPTNIILDGVGNVYVSDLNTNVVKVLVNTGALTVTPLNTSVTTNVTNTGNVNLTITSLTLGQGASSSFTETDTCKSAPIVPGGTCAITIKYSNASGSTTDTLTINSNAYTQTAVTIKLTH